jgi:hypothetical protein
VIAREVPKREGKREETPLSRKNAVGVVVSVLLCSSSDNGVVVLILITALYFENSAFEASFGGVAWEWGLLLEYVYDACGWSSFDSGFPGIPICFVADEEAEEHGGIHVFKWY